MFEIKVMGGVETWIGSVWTGVLWLNWVLSLISLAELVLRPIWAKFRVFEFYMDLIGISWTKGKVLESSFLELRVSTHKETSIHLRYAISLCSKFFFFDMLALWKINSVHFMQLWSWLEENRSICWIKDSNSGNCLHFTYSATLEYHYCFLKQHACTKLYIGVWGICYAFNSSVIGLWNIQDLGAFLWRIASTVLTGFLFSYQPSLQYFLTHIFFCDFLLLLDQLWIWHIKFCNSKIGSLVLLLCK